jgi:hypothetical protein
LSLSRRRFPFPESGRISGIQRYVTVCEHTDPGKAPSIQTSVRADRYQQNVAAGGVSGPYRRGTDRGDIFPSLPPCLNDDICAWKVTCSISRNDHHRSSRPSGGLRPGPNRWLERSRSCSESGIAGFHGVRPLSETSAQARTQDCNLALPGSTGQFLSRGTIPLFPDDSMICETALRLDRSLVAAGRHHLPTRRCARVRQTSRHALDGRPR